MRIGKCTVACAAVCLSAAVGHAQQRGLTLEQVLERARERAPQVVSARLALDEARGRLLGADLRFQSNPELEASIGTRRADGEDSTEFEIGVGQWFEPPSRRAARVAGANAALARGAADLEEATRLVLHDAGRAYFRALHAQERIRLLGANQQLADRIASVAEQRYKAGDIAVLDVNIARTSVARARADREVAEAARVLALGELRTLLQLDEGLIVAGSFASIPSMDLSALVQSALNRPELRALEADVAEAEADARLGQSLARADYGFQARYAREEGDQIIVGGFAITLPIFSRGQELQATGRARATRLRAALDAARTRIDVEVRSAHEAYSRLLAAVRALDAAVPGLDENDALTTRSYEVGELGLPELLLIRREILETRLQHLDALLEAALAQTDLEASAGLLQ